MPDDPAETFADSVTAMLTARAVIKLHGLLRDKGVITPPEYEAMRHLFLHEFDATTAQQGLVPAAREAIEARRAVLERAWDARSSPSEEPGVATMR